MTEADQDTIHDGTNHVQPTIESGPADANVHDDHKQPDDSQHVDSHKADTDHAAMLSPPQFTNDMSPATGMPHSMMLSHIQSPTISPLMQQHAPSQPPVQQFDLTALHHLSPQQQHKISQLQRLISLNQQYQQYVRNTLDRITHELHELSEKRRLVQIICNKQQNRFAILQSSVTRDQLFGSPYFIDGDGSQPQPNIEAVRKAKYNSKPAQTISARWTEEDQEKLRHAVISQCQDTLLRSEAQRIRHHIHKQRTDDMTSTQIELQIQHELHNIQQRIKSMRDDELLMHTDGVDWSVVSYKYVESHSPHNCKIQWLFNDDPRINKSEWSKDEADQLVSIVQQYNGHDWISIAKQLNSNRTPMQCLQQYQRQSHPIISTNKWSAEEEQQIIRLVEQCGDNDWPAIAQQIPGRASTTTHKRWVRAVNPAIRNGRWSRIEDMRLKLAIKAYGEQSRSWASIQRHVPGRTDIKCRERWINVLRPDIVKRKWNKQDDERLLQLVKQYGTDQWTTVAQQFTNRTMDRVLARWCAIGDKPAVKQYLQQCEEAGVKLPTAVKRGPYKKKAVKVEPEEDGHGSGHENGDGEESRKKQRASRKQRKAKHTKKKHENGDEHHTGDDAPALPPLLPPFPTDGTQQQFPMFGLLNQSANGQHQPLFYSLHPPPHTQQQQHSNNTNDTQQMISPTIAPLTSVLSPVIGSQQQQRASKATKGGKKTKKAKSKIVDE